MVGCIIGVRYREKHENEKSVGYFVCRFFYKNWHAMTFAHSLIGVLIPFLFKEHQQLSQPTANEVRKSGKPCNTIHILIHNKKMHELILLFLVLYVFTSTVSAFQLLNTESCNPLRTRLCRNDAVIRLNVLNSMATTSAFWNEPISFRSQSLFSYPLWSYEYEEEDDELYFLPINSFDLPPQTDYILRKITNAYIQSDVKDISQEIDFMEIVDMIGLEYKWSPHPYTIGSKLFVFSGQKDDKELKAQKLFSKLISFAALHRLPKEMATVLFGKLKSNENCDPDVANELRHLVIMFESESWESITFPRGLSIRIKREYLQSKRKRYSLIPRNSILAKSNNALQATDAIKQALLTKPPPKLVHKEDIVAEIDEIARELGEKSEFSQRGDSLVNELLTFFPRENKFLTRLSRATSKQTKRLQSVGRAGLISYGILNFMWYTLAIIWRWNRLSSGPSVVLVEGKLEALRISVRKFA